MILEAIVTTGNPNGTTNIAPMGPFCPDPGMASFELRPFCSATTFQNLKRTGQGVLHVTDDVLVFARAAIGSNCSDHRFGDCITIDGCYLTECCRCYEFETTHLDESEIRASIQCRTLKTHRLRDFFGFNRAMHAVIEASILATRTDFLPHQEVLAQYEKLKRVVLKTGGTREKMAFEELRRFVEAPNIHPTSPSDEARHP